MNDIVAAPFVPQFPRFIDSSMLGAFKSCPQLFYKSYIHQWKPKEGSVHLHAGGAFAKGLEVARRAYYCGEFMELILQGVEGPPIWTTRIGPPGDADLSKAYGLKALLAFYGDFETPADSAKSANRMAGALEFYFENYPLHPTEGQPITLPGGRKGIEFSFAHPLPILNPQTGEPILYVGRMDYLMHFANGVFIEDDKTTTQLGASWSRQWDLRAQFTGYAWGCREAGIHVDGAVVRGVSILKTKYETQAPITYRPAWQIDRWYEEMLDWVQDIVDCWNRDAMLNPAADFAAVPRRFPWRHNLDHSCAEYGGCQFRLACQSQDETTWLETFFERREWNPLAREETKL